MLIHQMTFVALSFIVVGWSAPGTASSDDASEWSQFRGQNGAGIFKGSNSLPVELSDAKTLRWKATIPKGHSSPIVVGDSVIVTGFEPGKLSTICLDRLNGELRWRQDLAVEKLEKTHPQHGPATATPVSDGTRVFSVFGSFGIIAYDLTGKELWRAARPARRNLFGSASSPIIADGKLIMFSGSEEESLLRAMDPASGEVIWERLRTGPASSWSTPVLWENGGQRALLIYEPFNLRACSLSDGTELWSVPGLADEPITVPLIHGGLIYTSSYNLRTNTEAIGVPAFDELLKQCDVNGDGKLDDEEAKNNESILSRPDSDGQGDHPLRMFFRMLDEDKDGTITAAEWPRIHSWMETWNHANGVIAVRPGGDGMTPSLAWKHELGVPECPTPVIVNDCLFAVRNGGVVTCLDSDSGVVQFQERIPAGGPYYASPVAGDNKIYLVSARGEVSVLSAARTLNVLSSHQLGEPVSATPALASGQLIIRSEKHLWLFEAAK